MAPEDEKRDCEDVSEEEGAKEAVSALHEAEEEPDMPRAVGVPIVGKTKLQSFIESLSEDSSATLFGEFPDQVVGVDNCGGVLCGVIDYSGMSFDAYADFVRRVDELHALDEAARAPAPVDLFPHMSPEAKGSGDKGRMGGASGAPEQLPAGVCAVDDASALCSKDERSNPQEPESFLHHAADIVAMAEGDPFWDGQEIWV